MLDTKYKVGSLRKERKSDLKASTDKSMKNVRSLCDSSIKAAPTPALTKPERIFFRFLATGINHHMRNAIHRSIRNCPDLTELFILSV
jgi:hypothetical protein